MSARRPNRANPRRSLVFVLVTVGLLLAASGIWAGEFPAEGEGRPNQDAFRRAVADLAHDNFAVREAAMDVLWKFHDEEAMESLVKYGASAETRVRAAIILDKFRWGIIPGNSPDVEALVTSFRDGAGEQRRTALGKLATMGELRLVARIMHRIENTNELASLTATLHNHWGSAVPAVLAAGREQELKGFLESMAVTRDGLRDLAAYYSARSTLEERIAAAKGDGGTPLSLLRRVWLLRGSGDHSAAEAGLESLRLQLGDDPPGVAADGMVDAAGLPDDMNNALRLQALLLAANDAAAVQVVTERIDEALPRLKLRDPGAALDLLAAQGRVAEAFDMLGGFLGESDPENVLRGSLNAETEAVRPTRFAKKALSLPADSTYAPTGITQREGLRALLVLCREHGFPELVEETGRNISTQLEKEEPFALAAFASWAARFPDLRAPGIDAVNRAVSHGVPVDFAIGPVFDEVSEKKRWFSQFTTSLERRSLLDQPIAPELALGFDGVADLPVAARGHLAMAKGAWAEAAETFLRAALDSGTLAGGAVHAYYAALAFERIPAPDKATNWRRIAETIPLGDEEARAMLADAMQRAGDIEGAERQRRLLINLHPWSQVDGDKASPHYAHALRIYAHSGRALEDPLAGAQLLANALTEVEADPRSVSLGELIRDCGRAAQLRMAAALEAGDGKGAAAELRRAHRFAPGDPAVFELLASRLKPGGPADREIASLAAGLLGKTRELWAQAQQRLPASPLCRKQLERCAATLKTLEK